MPTVATELVFITAVVNAQEGLDVACVNILRLVLHTDVEEDIIMVFKGRLAELMVQVTPNLFRKYITLTGIGCNTLCQYQDAESSVRASQECHAFLQEACSRFRKTWVCAQESIGLVCGQQGCEWKADDCLLAC